MALVSSDVSEALGDGATLAFQALQKKLTGPAQHPANLTISVPRFGHSQDRLNVLQLDVLRTSTHVNQSNHRRILSRLIESAVCRQSAKFERYEIK
jgi:hypothetical protein